MRLPVTNNKPADSSSSSSPPVDKDQEHRQRQVSSRPNSIMETRPSSKKLVIPAVFTAATEEERHIVASKKEGERERAKFDAVQARKKEQNVFKDPHQPVIRPLDQPRKSNVWKEGWNHRLCAVLIFKGMAAYFVHREIVFTWG